MKLRLLSLAATASFLFFQALSLARQKAVTRALARGDLNGAQARSVSRRFEIWKKDLIERMAAFFEKKMPGALKTRAEGMLLKAGRNHETAGLLVARGFILALVIAPLLAMVMVEALLPAFLLALALPWIQLGDQASRRLESLQRELSDTVDLIAACVLAGLGLNQALSRVGPVIAEGPLKHELQRSLQDLELGRSLKDTLRAFQKRAGCEDVDELVVALIQADQQGSSLAPTLQGQARQLRALRSLRAQKKAAEAPLKMLFPLMVFILPVVFIVLMGPIFMAFQSSGF